MVTVLAGITLPHTTTFNVLTLPIWQFDRVPIKQKRPDDQGAFASLLVVYRCVLKTTTP
jgi:hypothetical protein